MASNSKQLIKFKNGIYKFTGNVPIYLQKHFFWEFRDLIKRQAEPSGERGERAGRQGALELCAST